MRFFALILFIAPSLLPADVLTDLKISLARLDGSDVVKARLEINATQDAEAANPGEKTNPVITAQVADGPAGLSITWDHSLLHAIDDEARAKSKDPNVSSPTRDAVEEADAATVANFLNASARLLRLLDQAQLVEDKLEMREGKSGRLVVVKLPLPLGDKDKRYIKESEMIARFWLGEDGLPRAVDTKMHLKGRAMMVITFETTETEEFSLAVVGRRLVVLRHAKETHSAGAGESNTRKSLATLSVIDS